MLRKELLLLCSRENLERLANWLKLTIDPEWSDLELVEKIHLETLYS